MASPRTILCTNVPPFRSPDHNSSALGPRLVDNTSPARPLPIQSLVPVTPVCSYDAPKKGQLHDSLRKWRWPTERLVGRHTECLPSTPSATLEDGHTSGSQAAFGEAAGYTVQDRARFLASEATLQVFSQSENDDPFPRPSAHVTVHADYLYTGGLPDHLVKALARHFEQVSANLLHQLSALSIPGKCPLSRCQNPLQPNQDQVLDDPDPNILWPAAQILPLERGDALSDLRFHLALAKVRWTLHRRDRLLQPSSHRLRLISRLRYYTRSSHSRMSPCPPRTNTPSGRASSVPIAGTSSLRSVRVRPSVSA
jgi:hypothetical protein